MTDKGVLIVAEAFCAGICFGLGVAEVSFAIIDESLDGGVWVVFVACCSLSFLYLSSARARAIR